MWNVLEWSDAVGDHLCDLNSWKTNPNKVGILHFGWLAHSNPSSVPGISGMKWSGTGMRSSCGSRGTGKKQHQSFGTWASSQHTEANLLLTAPLASKQPLTQGPKPWKYGNMHLNCLEEKVTAYVRAPTMAFCPCHNSSCKEQRRHLFSGTTEQIICQLQINRYLQTRPVIKGCLNHLAYFLQEV